MSAKTEQTPPQSLKRRLYLYAFVDELGPLLAIYTLWFADHAITASQVSLVFALWAAIGIVIEVPSGALADQVDRRRLVAAAMVFRAVGIGVWLVWPTFLGVVVGAVLWAIHTAAASGTWEALVYDELSAVEAEEHYPVVMARIGQCSHLGTALGGASAMALLALGAGLEVLGIITIVLHVPALWAVLSLPNARPISDDDDDDAPLSFAAWWQTLRLGVQAISARRSLALIAITAMVIEGLFVLDEYVPLLARFRNAPDALVPLFVAAVWGGLIGGGEIAARAPRLRGPWLSVLIVIGLAAGVVAVVTTTYWTLALVGVTYGAMNAAWVLTEARLQEHAPSAARATTRSVVALFAGVISTVAFVVVRALSDGEDASRGILCIVGALAGVALLLVFLPSPATGEDRT